MRLIIISGLSGSGKSTAARALEDDGFFVVDNLPLALLGTCLELSPGDEVRPQNLAVVIDARNRAFLAGLDSQLEGIASAGHAVDIFFFDADDETLLRRYSETRRRHPLAVADRVDDGIRQERQLLAGLRNRATRLIDSTGLTPHQLRTHVLQLVRNDAVQPALSVYLQSFGFRYGIPPGSDLVFDVRFLPNPHFIPALRPLSGEDRPVRDYLAAQPVTATFLHQLQGLLQFLLPHYRAEGKSYLTISLGCTGGRHRSVAMVESLGEFFRCHDQEVKLIHRDVDKG